MIMSKANQFILNYNIENLSFGIDKLNGIAMANGWKLGSYKDNDGVIDSLNLKDFTKHNGFTYSFTEGLSVKTIILYNSDLPVEEQLFTILHEFAHIFLNHTKEEKFTEKQEREANEFACEVLAPSCILKGKVSSIDSLRKTTNLPIAFCEEHLERISKRKISDYSSTSVINMMKFEEDRKKEFDKKRKEEELKKFYEEQKIKSEMIKDKLEVQRLKEKLEETEELKRKKSKSNKLIAIICGTVGVAVAVTALALIINSI